MGRIKGIFDSWGERRYKSGEATITKTLIPGKVIFVSENNEKNRVIVTAVVTVKGGKFSTSASVIGLLV